MDKVIEKAEQILPLHDTSVNAILTLPSGNRYEIYFFETEFQQTIDYKNQPQKEVKGGLLSFTLHQSATEELNRWMFGSNVPYSGTITFESHSRIATPELIIKFTDGHCVGYHKEIGEYGENIVLRLTVSAKEVAINEIDHRNDIKSYYV
ncbi:MAG: hypothetical protein LBV74_13920 [Tannerella sp.]|nr:hypothetical protein [Tannerella sp.]